MAAGSVTKAAAMILVQGALAEAREMLEEDGGEVEPWAIGFRNVERKVLDTIDRGLPPGDLIVSGLIFKVEDA